MRPSSPTTAPATIGQSGPRPPPDTTLPPNLTPPPTRPRPLRRPPSAPNPHRHTSDRSSPPAATPQNPSLPPLPSWSRVRGDHREQHLLQNRTRHTPRV